MHRQECDGEALIALCGEMEVGFVKKGKNKGFNILLPSFHGDSILYIYIRVD